MKFNYKARTRDGKIETGVIDASGREAAAVLLQKYNIFITSLTQETEKSPLLKGIKFEKKVSNRDLVIFSRQLAVMLESRVSVIQSLSSLAIQTKKDNFKKIILEISGLVEEGIPLSGAFSRYPKLFDNFYVNLVKSGEVSGKISQTLYYISDHLEAEQDIISKVRQAMIYPLFTVSVLFVVLNIIIIFLLPRVQELIMESSNDPSAFTVFTMNFYEFLGNWWWITVLLLSVIVTSLVFYVKTKQGREIYDVVSLKIPFMGDILRKVFLARFCGNISTLIVAGISINKALKITADTVNNSVYKNIIGNIEQKVSEGEKISSVLGQYPVYFPSFVIQMIKVGEETGKLDKTLMEVVVFYQKEIKRSIDLFLTLLEPMLILFLGAIVGLLAISVFAPLYSTLGNI
ncbi:MAG: type II secretion system F family protein [Candidatus Staskawiczbacteria bacterium]|nr:type II secretion system F family protein [Candidatus Staskawiczbacteria bacterium]